MQGAKSLLDQLMNARSLDDVKAMQNDPGVQSMLTGTGGLATGAVAGGLMGLLLGGKGGRKFVGKAAKVGGAALIGGLAYKAYRDWQAGKAPQQAAPDAIEPPQGTAFMPEDDAGSDDLSTKLLRAMIAAAKADGHIDTAERDRIMTQLEALGLGAEAEALIRAEVDAPLDVGALAESAGSEEEAMEIYAASLLTVDPEGPAEKGYLAMLAARLGLDPGLVAHLHAKAATL